MKASPSPSKGGDVLIAYSLKQPMISNMKAPQAPRGDVLIAYTLKQPMINKMKAPQAPRGAWGASLEAFRNTYPN